VIAVALRWLVPAALAFAACAPPSAATAQSDARVTPAATPAAAEEPAAPPTVREPVAAPQDDVEAPPPLPREFRAAWVATVDNIDFPSRPGLPAAQLRVELDAIVARAVELKLNALVFQVRPSADALYESKLEPWSEFLVGEQGKRPDGGFDPLAYLIDRCHQRGMQLHAWFNPFRAWHPACKSKPHDSHVTQKAPQLCVTYGKYQWMDPGNPTAAKWSLATIQDVVRRYDVDGVHVDDYFYPYPEAKKPFPDDASYARYRAGGGRLGRSDWRRKNIDDYVQEMRAMVHADKPHVAVGISPFGVARPGVPKGISAGIDQYEDLAADVVKWLREGWLDYLAPQLYWPIDQKAQAFDVLLKWWHTQNPKQRAIWPGINPGRALDGARNWRPDELADQIALVRGADRFSGHIHFSFKALRKDAPNVALALRDRIYGEPAVAPAMPWLPSPTPQPPVARVEAGGRATVAWTADPDARFVAVQVRERSRWRMLEVVGGNRTQAVLPEGINAVAVTAVGRNGAASKPVALAVPTPRR
jgi:uncharacterized lipoprotein YddW (UPF0748 family)